MQAFKGWNEIAKVVRESEFEDSRDEQIDIFDVKVKFIRGTIAFKQLQVKYLR